MATATATGRIAQVIGSTFDAEFDEGHLPEIYNALTIEAEEKGVKIRPDRRGPAAPGRQPGPLRGPGLDRRPGPRAWTVVDTGGPVSVPVGKETLGRVFNLLGEPIDGRGPVHGRRSTGRSTAIRRRSTTSRPRPRSSRPASRSSTC